jgi:hypothetical protein
VTLLPTTVDVLSRCGELPALMLADHIPGPSDRPGAPLDCEWCTEARGVPVSWPCELRSLALDAFVAQRRVPAGALVVPLRDGQGT